MKKTIQLALLLLATASVSAQDTEGVYDRPFIDLGTKTAVGGYLEANTNYFAEDGVTTQLTGVLSRTKLLNWS